MNEIIEKLSEKELDTLRKIAYTKGLDEEASKSLLHIALVDISLKNDEFSCELMDYVYKLFVNELYEMLKDSSSNVK